MTPRQLAELMSLNDKLAVETQENFFLWGKPGQTRKGIKSKDKESR